nr:gliding motility-associated C-terminal domain-containing protein [Bacteroidales bacterium]
FTMHIYSRFGQLIWSTSDLETGWDGTVDGREAPNGIYTWVIRLTTNKGRIEDQAGNVVLIRTE